MIVMSWFELVQTLIHTIPFPMDIVDEKGTILFQNDVFKDMFGEDAIGKKCWDLYQDDKSQCVDCPLRKEIIIGETKTTISYNTLGGRTYNVHHTGMMYDGKKAMLEIFVDITERTKIMDDLEKSEEQFRQLFGNMEQGFALHEMMYDEDGEPIDYMFIMVNKSFEKLTGIKGENIVGRTVKEVLPDLDEMWIEKYNDVTKTGVPSQFEGPVEFGDSKWFNVTAYRPKEGFFANVFYDSTRNRIDEETIKDKQKFIESILNVCPSVIYVYDLVEKKNIYSNKGVEDILGYKCEDFTDMGSDILKKLMHPKDYDIYIKETLPKYKKLKDRTLKHSYRMKHKNGKWVRLLATEVIYKTDNNGKPIQIIGNIIKQ